MRVADLLAAQAKAKAEAEAQGMLPGMEALAPVAAPVAAPKMPRRSLAELEAQGAILGFQGENRWMSNFWRARVLLDGVAYPTVEHAYVAAKVDGTTAASKATRAKIAMLSSPAEAKRLGRTVGLRGDWEAVKGGIMLDLVRQKFTGSPELAAKLRATGNRPIVELNTWGDRTWGMIALKSEPATLEGRNRLGEILEKVRAEL